MVKKSNGNKGIEKPLPLRICSHESLHQLPRGFSNSPPEHKNLEQRRAPRVLRIDYETALTPHAHQLRIHSAAGRS